MGPIYGNLHERSASANTAVAGRRVGTPSVAYASLNDTGKIIEDLRAQGGPPPWKNWFIKMGYPIAGLFHGTSY